MNDEIKKIVDGCFAEVNGARNKHCIHECGKKKECGMNMPKSKDCRLMSYFIRSIQEVNESYLVATRLQIAVALYPFTKLGKDVKIEELFEFFQSGEWKIIRKAHDFSDHAKPVRKKFKNVEGGKDLAYCLIALDLLHENERCFKDICLKSA